MSGLGCDNRHCSENGFIASGRYRPMPLLSATHKPDFPSSDTSQGITAKYPCSSARQPAGINGNRVAGPSWYFRPICADPPGASGRKAARGRVWPAPICPASSAPVAPLPRGIGAVGPISPCWPGKLIPSPGQARGRRKPACRARGRYRCRPGNRRAESHLIRRHATTLHGRGRSDRDQ